MGAVRQRAFIATYKQMIEDKKKLEGEQTRVTKAKRLLVRALIAIGVLTMIYFKFKPTIDEKLGWNITSNTSEFRDGADDIFQEGVFTNEGFGENASGEE